MKTLCNEFQESVYLFPDFIPIRFDEDLGQWWIQDKMIEDIPHFYTLHEDVDEPKNWYKKKYKYDDGQWKLNVDWDADDIKAHKVLERKLNKMLKILYQKDVFTKEEMNNLFHSNELI